MYEYLVLSEVANQVYGEEVDHLVVDYTGHWVESVRVALLNYVEADPPGLVLVGNSGVPPSPAPFIPLLLPLLLWLLLAIVL